MPNQILYTGMKPGDRIVFNKTIRQGASCDTPSFILAKKEEEGMYLRRSPFNTKMCLVKPDNGNEFYAYETEFNVIK